MISIVPNMVTLLNSSQLVAQLLSYTNGSLEQLIKIPACNIEVLGQIKHSNKERGGMVLRLPFLRNNNNNNSNPNATSNNSSIMQQQQQQQQPHTGILVQCDLVQSVPIALQKKVLKLVLCIRCDYDYYIKHGRTTSGKSTHTLSSDTNNTSTTTTSTNKSPGYIFRQQIQTKIQQLLEPDKAPVLKALPKPDLTVKKRRGGQRMRRLKGRYEETALMKQANTRAFSIQTGEYGDDAMGRTLGLLEMSTGSVGGSTGQMNEHGTIRNKNHIEIKKMKYANTRASRKKMAQMNRYGGSVHATSSSSSIPNMNSAATTTATGTGNTYSSGLVSSVVFTPSQGMELVNPDAQKDRIKEANRKWFQDNAGFQSALPKK
jgi:U4/U6 small nuclear ribonucleoprotein PRP31